MKTGTTSGNAQNISRYGRNSSTSMNETTIAEESGKTHDYYTQEYGIPGNKKGRKSTQQRTRINAHANIEIHHNGTHESIDRRNTAEKHKHRHNMEAHDDEY